MKYKPCFYCAKKPKAYKEYDSWFIDHECIVPMGRRYYGSEKFGTIVNAWNRDVELDEFEVQAM